MVQVRNPHGNQGFEWTGDWSDTSLMWKSISRNDRRNMQKNQLDGCFWMSMEDFSYYFELMTLCYLQTSWDPRDVTEVFGSFIQGKFLIDLFFRYMKL